MTITGKMLNQRKYKAQKHTNTGFQTMTPRHSSHEKTAPAVKGRKYIPTSSRWVKKKEETKISPRRRSSHTGTRLNPKLKIPWGD